MQTIKQAIDRLEKSERGQRTCQMLLEFLNSDTVKFLDGMNCEACELLFALYMCGNSSAARIIVEELTAVVERHKWLTETPIAK